MLFPESSFATQGGVCYKTSLPRGANSRLIKTVPTDFVLFLDEFRLVSVLRKQMAPKRTKLEASAKVCLCISLSSLKTGVTKFKWQLYVSKTEGEGTSKKNEPN